MATPETPPDGSDARPVPPDALIFGGPLLAIVAYGVALKLGGHSADSDGFWLLGVLAATATPFAGGLMLEGHLAVRLWIGLMLGIAGGLVFFCAGIPVWLLAGMPGFSPG